MIRNEQLPLHLVCRTTGLSHSEEPHANKFPVHVVIKYNVNWDTVYALVDISDMTHI